MNAKRWIMIGLGLAVVSMLGVAELRAQEKNLVKNERFELDEDNNGIPDGWIKPENGRWSNPGYQSEKCIEVTNSTPSNHAWIQKIALNGEEIEEVAVSCFVKGENIKAGEKEWEKAMVYFTLSDKSGKRIGNYYNVFYLDGTFDWMNRYKVFSVPKEAAEMRLRLGFSKCSGTVYFDSLKVFTSERLEDVKSGNLVKNSSFEESYPDISQPRYWQVYPSNNSGAVDENMSRSGEKSLVIHTPNIETKYSGLLYFQVVPVKPNTEYTLSGWMKNKEYVIESGSLGCAISVISSDWKKNFVKMGQRVKQGSKWKKFSKTFLTDEDTKAVLVRCIVSGVSGDTWFDDISLVEVSPIL